MIAFALRLHSMSRPEAEPSFVLTGVKELALGKYFILWDIVDPRTESNPNPNPKPKPNPEPKPNPNPNPDPNCGFTIFHKMKYLRDSSLKDRRLSEA